MLTDAPRIQWLDLAEAGECVAVKYLNSGSYSAAYQAELEPSRVFILVEQPTKVTRADRSKEILARARRYHHNKHLPSLTCHGKQYIGGVSYEVWETTYSLSADTDGSEHLTPEAATLAGVYPMGVATVDSKAKVLNLSPSIVQALRDIERAALAFGCSNEYATDKRFNFDLHNGNFGLDPDSKTLILRDPITAFF